MTKHVAVLKGGWSAEREVSLVSGKACADALREAGYRVSEIDVQPNIAQVLTELKPDAIFNALHGRYGEDGCIQGLLEILKIPYTHSGVLASSIAMDKPMARHIFMYAGLRCPEGRVISREEALAGDPLPRPYVVKPINEGSSVGVRLLLEDGNFFFTADNWTYGTHALAEVYIPGRELTVAVLDGEPLAVTELRPHQGFYDYDNKYTGGRTDHIIPAPVSQEIYHETMRMAAYAHQVLGCRGLSRSDFRYDDTKPGTSGLYILELNTQPGFTPLSLSPEQAIYRGMSFTSLVQTLIEDATVGR